MLSQISAALIGEAHRHWLFSTSWRGRKEPSRKSQRESKCDTSSDRDRVNESIDIATRVTNNRWVEIQGPNAHSAAENDRTRVTIASARCPKGRSGHNDSRKS